MKKLLTTACLFVVTTVAIVPFIAPAVFGQGKKTVNVEGGVSKAIPAAVEWQFDKAQPDWKPALLLAGVVVLGYVDHAQTELQTSIGWVIRSHRFYWASTPGVDESFIVFPTTESLLKKLCGGV